jgi:hypothetical protein
MHASGLEISTRRGWKLPLDSGIFHLAVKADTGAPEPGRETVILAGTAKSAGFPRENGREEDRMPP